MKMSEAEDIIESLRKGIPPEGYVRSFTVGRQHEIDELVKYLEVASPNVLLLKANYGTGKTHLLRFIKEMALDKGYAVSLVTLDAYSAVRFNRMDQIVGAVWSGLELPGLNSEKGVAPFFKLIQRNVEQSQNKGNTFWNEMTNQNKWNYSDALDSAPLFVAIRAWHFGSVEQQKLVEDWLCMPWQYEGDKKKYLYNQLIGRYYPKFIDPRSERQIYQDSVLQFRPNGYLYSWNSLKDIQRISLEMGLKGLIILFDEFEDVIINLNRINLREDAFWNLFQFQMGKKFPGLAYFAVTPDFVNKCKNQLYSGGRWDFDYSQFDNLASFALTSLREEDMLELMRKIVNIHGKAYGWEPQKMVGYRVLLDLVKRSVNSPIDGRNREAIKNLVNYLDNRLEEHE